KSWRLVREVDRTKLVFRQVRYPTQVGDRIAMLVPVYVDNASQALGLFSGNLNRFTFPIPKLAEPLEEPALLPVCDRPETACPHDQSLHGDFPFLLQVRQAGEAEIYEFISDLASW